MAYRKLSKKGKAKILLEIDSIKRDPISVAKKILKINPMLCTLIL